MSQPEICPTGHNCEFPENTGVCESGTYAFESNACHPCPIGYLCADGLKFQTYWMQDFANTCNMDRDIGYTSWSLVCRGPDKKQTTCSVLIDSMTSQYTDIQWTKSAKYVTLVERKIRNIDPIINSSMWYSTVYIHEFSEIKDGCLWPSRTKKFANISLTIASKINRTISEKFTLNR